ncbi:MAG: Ribosomal RNA large subunit methyltransferase I [Syntrophus sp. SKADARSKE-3]|nr:Ribosomal RNA large subunit methyltransferase I [Syntrophus sp. SKADARSKE-3]
MTNSAYSQIILKPGRERSLLKGHPWVFSGAVAQVAGSPEPGDIVCICGDDRRPLALGFFNAASDIAFRAVTTDIGATIDEAFWRRRLHSAAALRRKVLPPDTTACRLINAEGDGMPGLIVDQYGSMMVLSISTAGMERYREAALDAIVEECRPKVMYERSEGQARRIEGLEDRIGFVFGNDMPEVVDIRENGLRFSVDVVSGQKTGFFLDQRDSRMLVQSLSRDASVLNCFSYTGAFSVYAARGGAKRVVSVEASAVANEAATAHLALNGFSSDVHPVIRADVFQYLRRIEEVFDFIILDPPAFAKAKRDINQAARGYKDINLHALSKLQPGGLLATFSCSNFIDEDLFEKIVLGAAQDAGRPVRLLKRLGPGADHPTNLAHMEGRYLKGLLLGLLD